MDFGNNARLTYRIVGGGKMFNTSAASSTSAAAASASAANPMAKNNNNDPLSLSSSTSLLVGELFGIFPNTGMLYLRAPLDREARDRYDITVEAIDNGTPAASATTHIVVSVLDANDNDPVFGRDGYHFVVEENLRRGAAVGQLLATDADVDENAAIRYSLMPGNTSFQINAMTGKRVCGDDVNICLS